MDDSSDDERRGDVVEIEQRIADLADVTALSDREAEVWVLKERGLTHAEIADEIGLAKSTVDELARRGQNKEPIATALDRARRTLEVLDDADSAEN